MNAAKDKAAWVLPTPQAAQEITHFEFTAEKKRFATLQAEFALKGHTFQRSSQNDGTVDYMAERWGLVRYFTCLDEAERFLSQIGGRE